MDRKVKLSIRIKIIAVTSALVLVSLGLYLFVALGLFNSDKSAYIYETSLNTAASIRSEAQSYLARVLKDSLNIYNLVVDRDLKPEREREPGLLKDLVPKKASFDVATAKGDAAALRKRFDAEKPGEKRDAVAAELALVYLKDGAVEEARKVIFVDEADPDAEKVELAKRPASWLYAAGLVNERRLRFVDAVESFEALVQSHPKDSRVRAARFRLGELSFRMRDFAKAETHYREALKIAEPEIAAYAGYKLGWSLWLQSRAKEAVEQLTRVLRLGAALPASVRAAVLADAESFFVETGELQAARRFFLAAKDADDKRLGRIEAEARRLKESPAARPGATSLIEGKRLLRSLFFGDPDIVEFSVYDGKGKGKTQRLVRLVNKEYLAESDLKESYLDRVDDERPIDFSRVTPQRPLLQNSSVKGGIGLLTIARKDPLTSRYFVVRLKMDRFLASFARNKVYVTYLMDATGTLFAHQDPTKLTSDVDLLGESYVVDALKSAVSESVREQASRSGEALIVAFAKVGVLDLYAFAEIRKDKAFQAARELTVKSIYIGITFIALAMIIGILFAKTLTGPIDRLFKGTQVIAGGNFKERVLVQSKDEIGILADSFNFMASRIVSLLEQEKDKVRMEEELKVAKLVQDSFFPATRLTLGRLDLAAFYTPSSECGGDWWGCVPIGNRVMILIGDATGHGVPAALITATAASCTMTVQELGRNRPELLDSPAEVLRLLNKAVYGASQGKILMTFFVAVVDPDKGIVTYSNASHNPPYLYRYKDGKDPDKKDLTVLQDAVSLRLGHKDDTVYEDATATISPQDVMVFFTDGFIECTNPDKEEFGNRKFIKAILKSAKAEPDELKDGIVKAAMDHYAGHPLGDDLTLVCAKLLPAAAAGVGDATAGESAA